MRKLKKLFILIFVLTVFGLVGCNKTIIEVQANQTDITIKDTEVANFDYRDFFSIRKNGIDVFVLDLYIDSSAVKNKEGTYKVSCTFEGESASLDVTVVETEYKLSLEKAELTLYTNEVNSFDFKSLFSASIDGEDAEILADMIVTDVKSAAGKYTYTVEFFDKSETLIINVEDHITVSSDVSELTFSETEVENYDFLKHFKITKNNEDIEVVEEFIDLSNLKAVPGTYIISCAYQNETVEINVIVEKAISVVTLSVEEMEIKVDDALDFDYNSLFEVTLDGQNVSISTDMVATNLEAKVGTYEYTITFNEVSKTLIINVIENNIIEAYPSYQNLDVVIDEIDTFDFTSLFSVYINGVAHEVKLDMLEIPDFTNVELNKSYTIKLSFTYKGIVVKSSALITPVEEDEIIITSKDIVTYPNDEHIDVTTLFTITKGNQSIPVTLDMIIGEIDYSTPGNYEIILSYEGHTKIAIIEVKVGVIIDYTTSDTVLIVKGTRQESYLFSKDFQVIINGVRMKNVDNSYLDVSHVDFNIPGSYEVTIQVPYNDKNLPPFGGINYDIYEKTITYVVVENEGIININNDIVHLPKGATSYNVYSNLTVLINNRKQALTEIKEYVDLITCYVETLSNPIDFTGHGTQEVKIAVYIYGVDNDPEIVTYQVVAYSDIVITQEVPFLFVGNTVYTTDLFRIFENGNEVIITNEMVSGKVNTFVPGTYVVTLKYLNLIEEAVVTVYDKDMVGSYQTNLPFIPIVEDDDDGPGWGDDDGGGWGMLVASTIPHINSISGYDKPDLIIDEVGQIFYGTREAEYIAPIDSTAMIIKIRSTEFVLSYENGIVFLNPINTNKFRFSEDRRPIPYFKTTDWTLMNHVLMNETRRHVLENRILTYSIDLFRVQNKHNYSSKWFGLYVALTENVTSNFIYEVIWDEVHFSDGIRLEAGFIGTLSLAGEDYRFRMDTHQKGSIHKAVHEKKFANTTFTGIINGKPAQLIVDHLEGFALVSEGKTIFRLTGYDMSKLPYGGVDYENNSVLIYGWDEDLFSYKFNLDLELKSFELVERDLYFGKYSNDNVFIFLDGYGSGLANFDTSRYYRNLFDYRVSQGIVELKFTKTSYTYTYGNFISLYIEPLLNVLRFKFVEDKSLEGVRLENEIITDGAIIKFKTFQIPSGTDTASRAYLYNNIEIITKDGFMSNQQKANLIDTSKISFNDAGFYQLLITISVDGQQIIVPYGIQVVEPLYEDNPLTVSYGSGVVNKKNTLSINKYGQVTFYNDEIKYTGIISSMSETRFAFHASSDTGRVITATASSIAPGVIELFVDGAITLRDYFTTGTIRTTGNEHIVLREFNISGERVYILSRSLSSLGGIVDVIPRNGIPAHQKGAIVDIISGDSEYFVRITDWSDSENGIQMADSYHGNYSLVDRPTLELDGFGNVRLGNEFGNYILYSNTVLVVIGPSRGVVFELDKANMTYKDSHIRINENLVKDLTFTTTHSFLCGSLRYEAETTFEFKSNGVVIVKSTSESHDGYNGCGNDRYEPRYASKTGVEGTYSIIGNLIKIVVNNVEFEFRINNILNVNSIVCTATTLESREHGHFSVGTIFRI